ncbi:MAG: hypothetical protein ABJN34_01070 [Litoreibacter sp.]|uniref:hypothetical protein n=1 Tax=Litoreibacter sp. TaxID=1969459 RepID=UPI0032968046
MLLAAHAAGDLTALTELYAKAASQAETNVARGFYLTQAYIFALEAGDTRAEALAVSLKNQGRL